jgi:tryptophanyl-tRNA synthetase
LLPGIDGQVMTDKNAIFLTDKPKDVYDKLMKAVILERKPFRCTLYEMLRFHHEDESYIEEIFEKCSNSNCSKCKKEIAEYFADWVVKLNERKKALEDDKDVLRFMLDQEIPRETESLNDVTEILR